MKLTGLQIYGFLFSFPSKTLKEAAKTLLVQPSVEDDPYEKPVFAETLDCLRGCEFYPAGRGLGVGWPV